MLFYDEEVFQCHSWVVVDPLFDHQVYATVLPEDRSHQLKVLFYVGVRFEIVKREFFSSQASCLG